MEFQAHPINSKAEDSRKCEFLEDLDEEVGVCLLDQAWSMKSRFSDGGRLNIIDEWKCCLFLSICADLASCTNKPVLWKIEMGLEISLEYQLLRFINIFIGLRFFTAVSAIPITRRGWWSISGGKHRRKKEMIIYKDVVPMSEISKNAPHQACRFAKYQKFWSQWIDRRRSIIIAWEGNKKGSESSGASTLPQQTGQKRFNGQPEGYVRKGGRAYLRVLVELIVQRAD